MNQSPSAVTKLDLSSPKEANGQPKRIPALDATRGLAVMGMILVVSPGSWNHLVPALTHAAWHGYTLADLVFPAFLFAVGLAMQLSFPTKLSPARALRRIGRRTVILIGIGIALNLLPSFDWSNLRIPGILQRIGLCYALAGGLALATANTEAGIRILNPRRLVFGCLVLLTGWFQLLTFTSAPGYPTGDLGPGGTIAAWVDQKVFTTSHMWPYGTDENGAIAYDPEGLLASLPATVNVLLGMLVGHYLCRAPTLVQLRNISVAGLALVLAGHLLDPLFPINKRIWTSSFALVSSGWTVLIYSGLALAMQHRAVLSLAHPLLILGGNATLAFILSQVFVAFSGFPISGTSPQQFGFDIAMAISSVPITASLMCAFGILGIIMLLLWPLHRGGKHLRI